MGNKIRHGYNVPPPDFFREYRKARKTCLEDATSLSYFTTTAWKNSMLNNNNVTRYLLEHPDYLDGFIKKYAYIHRFQNYFQSPNEVTVKDSSLEVNREHGKCTEFDRFLQRMYFFMPLFFAPKEPLLSEVERILTGNEYNESNPPPDIESHLFANTEIPQSKLSHVFMYMIETLLGSSAFSKPKLAYFIAMVQENYYDQPQYHNYYHAIGHAQSMYWLLRNNSEVFSELEMKTLIIASVSHDLSHPGFNDDLLNSAFSGYKFDLPHMEQFHTQILYTLIFNERSNIFSSLDEGDFLKVIKDLRMCILSTYFKEFAEKVQRLKVLTETKFDFHDPECRDLAKSILMMVCDLSSSWRSWKTHMSTTWLVYKEFYKQAEEMEKLGFLVPPAHLRKNMTEMPKTQIEFLQSFIIPMFREAAKLFPCLVHAIEQIEENTKYWIEGLGNPSIE